MGNSKENLIIDICVIPPLEETLEGFANPSGDFARYTELYGDETMESLLSSIRTDPSGFLLGLMDDAGVDRAVLTTLPRMVPTKFRICAEKADSLSYPLPKVTQRGLSYSLYLEHFHPIDRTPLVPNTST